nr:hypothetical protein [Tanacetum cinerariifolium]
MGKNSNIDARNVFDKAREGVQAVNMKFLNILPLGWSKFVADVKSTCFGCTSSDEQVTLSTTSAVIPPTSISTISIYILAFSVWNTDHSPQYASQAPSKTPLSLTYLSNDFQSFFNHNVYNASSSIPQMEYAPTVHLQSEFSQPDTGLVFLVFQKGDDLIDAINHMMSFLTEGEGHMSKQCTKPKRKRDEVWFKDKVLLVQAQANGQVLQEEELEFLADPGIAETSSTHSPALQDDPILSVIEQLKTQVRILEEENNVDKASASCTQSLEIDNLKHILSEHLKEKESLVQKVTLLKNDFQKEESQNIERELALEKQKTDAIVIHDSEETLMLEDEGRSKMLQKQNDLIMSEKKVITKPVDYATLNQLSKDFETRFVPQTKLSTEQAFWSRYSVQSEEPNLSSSTTIVEVPKELPKVSMNVNVCERYVTIETELQKDFNKKECYDTLFKKYNTIEKHCISLEVDNQLKNEILQRNNLFSQQSALTFVQLFKLNDLKDQSQEKDTVIMKLKERLQSLSGNVKEEKIKGELEEIETKNIDWIIG